jgi:septal ring-binding cell division protein DamX
MRPVIGAAALGALALGGALVLATSRHSSDTQASQAAAPVATTAPAPVAPVAPAAIADTTAGQPVAVPVAQTVTTRTRRDAYRNGGAYRPAAPARTRVVRHTRSTKHSVEIIGGSAVGGALVGGLVGGKKGAVIGGLVGGTAGTVYDRKTRHKVHRE